MKSKVNFNRTQLLKILKEHGFEKKAVAKVLGVNEASIRRACERHNIDTQLEKKSSIAQRVETKYTPTLSKIKGKVNEGTFVSVPDMHAHTVNWAYLKAVCAFIKDFRPKILIQLGDVVDFECLMKVRHQKYPSFDGEDILSLDKEFQAVAKIFSMLNQSVSAGTKKIFLKGNHEYRADEILKSHPEFDSLINIEKRVDLTGWQVMPYLEPIKLGKLNFIHGEFYGTNHVQKHLRHYQKNVVYGHTHAIQQDTMASPMRQIPIWGASIGCGCDLNPDYQRNKSNQWQHGFAYGWFEEESGDFDCQIKRVINGKFWAEGRRYSA